MADPKGLDPFEAFKAKKAAAAKQGAEIAKADEANKKLGWVDGIGPTDGKVDPTKPKGFSRGRFVKPPVKEDELKKLKPKKYEDGKFAKPKAKPVTEDQLPPEEDRRPDKFRKF